MGKHQINAILCKSYQSVVRQHDRKLKNRGNKLRLYLERIGVRVIAGAKAFLQL